MYFYLQSFPVLLSPNDDQNQPKVEQEVSGNEIRTRIIFPVLLDHFLFFTFGIIGSAWWFHEKRWYFNFSLKWLIYFYFSVVRTRITKPQWWPKSTESWRTGSQGTGNGIWSRCHNSRSLQWRYRRSFQTQTKITWPKIDWTSCHW